MELLEKAALATSYLLENGCTPYIYTRVPYRQPEAKASGTSVSGNNGHGAHSKKNDDPSWCPIHDCTMKRWEKNGCIWYSHKTGDGWCTGK